MLKKDWRMGVASSQREAVGRRIIISPVTTREKAHAVLDRLPDDRMEAALAALEAVNGRDLSFGAIRDRLGTEPRRVTDFEANYGPVQSPDGDG